MWPLWTNQPSTLFTRINPHVLPIKCLSTISYLERGAFWKTRQISSPCQPIDTRMSLPAKSSTSVLIQSFLMFTNMSLTTLACTRHLRMLLIPSLTLYKGSALVTEGSFDQLTSTVDNVLHMAWSSLDQPAIYPINSNQSSCSTYKEPVDNIIFGERGILENTADFFSLSANRYQSEPTGQELNISSDTIISNVNQYVFNHRGLHPTHTDVACSQPDTPSQSSTQHSPLIIRSRPLSKSQLPRKRRQNSALWSESRTSIDPKREKDLAATLVSTRIGCIACKALRIPVCAILSFYSQWEYPVNWFLV